MCAEYGSVLTVGPDAREVKDFNHPDHKIVTFTDISHPSHPTAPTKKDVLEAVSWGVGRDSLLVHCHAGISRSTATAWGIAIGNGIDPEEAIQKLLEAHPIESNYYGIDYNNHKRPFSPNRLMVRHLQEIFRYNKNELINLLDNYKTEIW